MVWSLQMSIPHLTAQKKYGTDRLNIIGVTNPDKAQDMAKIDGSSRRAPHVTGGRDEGEMGRD